MENSNEKSIIQPIEIPQLTPESLAFLVKAAKWGKFMAILGFIVTGLLLVSGILMSFVFNAVQDEMVPLNIPFPPMVLSVIYILIAGVYIIPVVFLNSFCNNVLKAANFYSTEHLTTSLKNLKNLFVFIGVSTVIILAIYLIALIIVGSAAVMSL
ncbi:MAG: hypothetical protein ACOYN4_01970 [Bacteroidales bacterium]